MAGVIGHPGSTSGAYHRAMIFVQIVHQLALATEILADLLLTEDGSNVSHALLGIEKNWLAAFSEPISGGLEKEIVGVRGTVNQRGVPGLNLFLVKRLETVTQGLADARAEGYEVLLSDGNLPLVSSCDHEASSFFM